MKQNNMQIPEGYKNSSLGIIPNDWEVKRLGDGVKELIAGVSVNSVENKASDSEFGILKTSAVSKGKFYKNENKRIIDKDLSRAKIRPKKNNLIISRMNTPDLVGECGLITEDYENLYLPDRLWQTVFQVSPCFTPRYINYLLNTSEYRRLIKDMATGTSDSMKNITKSDWLSLKVSIPPLPQQQKIAEILGTWDEAIEKQSKLIDKLTDRKRGLMQQLLTGKKRLAGFSEEWKEVRLGEIGERVVRKNTEKNHNVVTISAQQGFVSQKDYFNKTIASEVTDNYYLIHKDEFCYNKSYSAGYPMGAIKRLKTFDKAVVTTLYICFKLKENISKDFFEQFNEGGNLINSLVKVANEGGRAHGLLNVTPVDFFNIKFTLPSLPEQTAIANILIAADKEIELAKSKLELLRSQKSGLMQQLLTGKTRVKID